MSIGAITSSRDNEHTMNKKLKVVSQEGHEFEIYLTLLENHSYYFKALRRSGMKECQTDVVTLPTITSSVLKTVKDYLETGKCPLDMSCVFSVLEACVYLQVEKMVDYCCQFLLKEMDVNNVIDIITHAEQYSQTSLLTSAMAFLQCNLTEFSKTKAFLELDLSNLTSLLDSNELAVSSECDVFDAAVRWLISQEEKEENMNVMKCIRWNFMTEKQFEQCTQKLLAEYGDNSKKLNLIELLNRDSMLSKIDLRGMRRPTDIIIACGGFTKSGSSTNRFQVCLTEELSKALPDERIKFHYSKGIRLPITLCEHCACVLDGCLFIAGGQSIYTDNGIHTTDIVYMLDPRFGTWSEVHHMGHKRSLFHMESLDGHLYVIGGWVGPNRVTKTVERYSPQKNLWEYVSSLDIGLHEHAGCNYGGSIYISGGYKGPQRGHLDKVFRYDPDTDIWTSLMPMLSARSYHQMVVVGDSLLVLGGVCYLGNDTFLDVKTCELYDIESNQWTMVATLGLPTSCAPALILNGNVYVFGGHSFSESESEYSDVASLRDSKDHRYVQVLDTKTWKCSKQPVEAQNILYYTLSMITVPGSLRIKFSHSS